jgi:Domain of unknown function (DUF5666)
MMWRNYTWCDASGGGVDKLIHTIKRGARTGMLAALALSTGVAGVMTTPREAIAQDAAKAPLQHQSGTIKSIDGSTLVVSPDSGADVTVTTASNTRVLRVEPGAKDLKSAQPYELSGLKVGDHVLAYGRDIAPDAKVFPAGILVVMKSEDVKAKQARDVAGWTARGTGGIVTATDAAAGTITISTRTATGTKPVIITTTKSTVLRRYAPDSTKFDDAKVAPFSVIVVGDQLRAKGTKNDDGTQFAADEVVSGHFQNLAGLVVSVDAAAKTVSVTDLIAKKIVTVKVTDQTNLRKLNPQMAQVIAARFKGATAGGAAGGSGAAGANGGAAAGGGATGGAGNAQANGGATGSAVGDAGAGAGGPGAGGAGRGARAGDFQALLARLPELTLNDFAKGDAVMIVGTSGTDDSAVTAITMLGGVEALMSAPAGASAASQALLSPWSLGGGGGVGGDAGAQ